MCGFAGVVVGAEKRHFFRSTLSEQVRAMSRRLIHRGPDDDGVWTDDLGTIGMGFRRLAILDLSPAGHQPMLSGSGRFVAVFNGEIYNHEDIRKELALTGAPLTFKGRSDTEVLLAAFDHWGIVESLGRCVGMFAIAVWDVQSRQLYLARDRIGEKPLYYGCGGGLLLFASELTAIRSHPAFEGSIDHGALAAFMRHGYVPAPASIYQGIRKLIPGTVVTITPRDVSANALPDPVPYWSSKDRQKEAFKTPFRGSDTDAVDELDRLLRCSIRQQLVADVPVGAFLSGGVDSSLVVALMRSEMSQPVMTFSIGFQESGFDEAPYARRVARHLGTQHTEMYVTAADAIEVVPRLPEIYDEPFADSSQIPTVLVSQLAKRKTTVCLSGDGGDELFGGYGRYDLMRRVWNSVSWLPAGIRRRAVWCMSAALSSVSGKSGSIAAKLRRNARVLAANSFEEAYGTALSSWRNSSGIVVGSIEDFGIFRPDVDFARSGLMRRMMFLDTVGYLPDDILVKVDRAAMHVSLETRVPLLDHRVVEFAMSLPETTLFRHGRGKWPLRQVLYRHVPAGLIDRPKMGFSVPLGAWLRGPLRDWAEDLLDEHRLRDVGHLDHKMVRTAWSEHLSGIRDRSAELWNVLMFQAWLSHTTSAVQRVARAA